jgi:class 3 adenylate cyclase/pimeloyl-ACP methyl ester carboxylesterase
MEPRIQYARTKDGVSIAFWTLGEGTPLVYVPFVGASHVQLEWRDADIRRWYEHLAQNRKLVRYDFRGSGLSERNVSDHSLDAHVLDLESVTDRLGLERFALFGPFHLGPPAIAYAARHPERVSRLVLWSTWARTSDYYRSPAAQTLGSLRDKDWETYTETVAHAFVGWRESDQAGRLSVLIREGISQQAMVAFVRAAREFDVTGLLPQVRSPTTVIHRRQQPAIDMALATDLAAGIPDARLVVLEGASGAPWWGDTEAVLAAIDEFLAEGEEAAAEPLAAGDVHTILFTDIEGSTALTQRLGDAKAQELVRTHNAIVRDALKTHSGSEIKHTGDGIMASFAMASTALECAIAIQRAVEGQGERLLRVRIGLNAGEPVAEEKDLFGTAVQLAKRICDRAEPGQILAPIVVRELAAGKGFLLADIGESELRGFEDPVRLYEVRWRD